VAPHGPDHPLAGPEFLNSHTQSTRSIMNQVINILSMHLRIGIVTVMSGLRFWRLDAECLHNVTIYVTTTKDDS